MIASGTIKNGIINLKLDNRIKKIDYSVNAKSKLMKELLNGVVKDVPVITVTSFLSGNYKHPDISVKSNLANAIQTGFKKQLQAKIDGYKNKIKNIVDNKVGKHKKVLESKYKKITAKQFKQMDKLKKDSQDVKKQANSKIKNIRKQKTKKTKKKVIKNLKKMFKF